MCLPLLILSCDDNANNEDPDIINYANIGLEHNEGLEYVLNNLEVGAITNQSQLKNGHANDILNLTRELCETFLREESNIAQEGLDEALTQLDNFYSENIVHTRLKNKTIDFAKLDASLSKSQRKYITEIKKVISDTTLDLKFSLSRIKEIEEIVKRKCSKQDCQIILTTASIARNSMEYWYNNYNKWLSKLCCTVVGPYKIESSQLKDGAISRMPPGWYPYPGDPTKCIYVDEDGYLYELKGPPGLLFNPEKECFDFPGNVNPNSYNWQSLVGADVAGGVAGAVGGAMVGGAGAVPGAIGGAIGGSAGEAFRQIFF
jgi:hypothetical protein